MTHIDIQVIEQFTLELQQVVKFMDGSDVEYAGRELVEDESIMGSCDKIIFNTKEMVSQLTKTPVNLLDPFIVCKLDVQSVYHHNFPKMQMNMNKYAMRKQGISGANYIVEQEKIVLTDIAKEKGKDNVDDAFKGFLGDRFKSNVAEGRNI